MRNNQNIGEKYNFPPPLVPSQKSSTIKSLKKKTSTKAQNNLISVTLLEGALVYMHVLAERTGLSLSGLINQMIVCASSPHLPFYLPDYLSAEYYRLQRKRGTLPIAPIGENALDMMQRDLNMCESCGINPNKVIAHWKRTAKKYDIELYGFQ